MVARVLNILLGSWLFVSAFVWPHASGQFHNAWICGALVVTFSVSALQGHVTARYANFAVGVWLLGSMLFVRPESAATAINHLIVGFAVSLLALFPLEGLVPGTAPRGRLSPARVHRMRRRASRG